MHPTACAQQQEKPLQREAGAPQLESGPRSPQLEKALKAVKTSTAKNKYIF